MYDVMCTHVHANFMSDNVVEPIPCSKDVIGYTF